IITIVRNLATMVADQRFVQQDDVLSLVAPKTDGADIFADLFLAERQHFFRSIRNREQAARRLVDPGIRCLRRQGDGNEKGKNVDMLQFALRLRTLDSKAAEDFVNLRPRVTRTHTLASRTRGRR